MRRPSDNGAVAYDDDDSDADDSTTRKRPDPDDKDVTEIRERYEDAIREWKPIRDAGQADVRALGKDGPWETREREARKAAGRPCLHFDELGQHVNQLINDVRASKRAIEVNPAGGDAANDANARYRADQIRQIEYRSNALHVYSSGFQETVQRGYGFWRVTSRFVRDQVGEDDPLDATVMDQELLIEPIPNPDIVTPDPYFKQPDFADAEFFFIEERFSHDEFRRRYPDAEVKNFSKELWTHVGSHWMTHEDVVVMEYWCKKSKPRELVLLRNPTAIDPAGSAQPLVFWRDTFDKKQWKTRKGDVIRTRMVDNPVVEHQLTNGVEILHAMPWPGKDIPIVGCLGKVLWIGEDGKTTREIHSLIRMAVDPQMMLDYYVTSEAEVVGQAPKFPYFTYKGQLDETQQTLIVKSVHEPVAVIEVNPTVDAARGQVLPFPSRQPYDPPIQAFEIGKESTRRSLQASTGAGFLPTQAQRQNEKSGVALRQIETSAQKGSFHFIDNFELAVRRTGVILNDLIPHFYDTARDVFVRKPDDTSAKVRINDPAAPPHPAYKQPVSAKDGEFDVTISTGPSYESERARADEFVESMAQNPQVFPLIGDLLVGLKGEGPVWDEMARRLKSQLPPGLQQGDGEDGQINPQALQQQLQQAQQLLQAFQQENQQLKQEIGTDQVKAQANLQLAQIKGQIDVMLAQVEGQIKMGLAKQKAGIDMGLQDDQQAHEMSLRGADAAQTQSQAEIAAAQQRRIAIQNAALGGGGGRPKA